MNILLKICLVLVVGVIGGKVARLLKLPNVTGYLVFGLFLGPSFIKYVDAADIETFSVISELALAIIAFTIGSEFLIKDMLRLGKPVVVISLAEVFFAITTVFCVMFFLFKQDFAFSIVIASMSAATAPAATLMVMKQYNAHGPLTETILPVVALDDVLGIVAFGIAISLAKLSISTEAFSWVSMVLEPLIEIGGSAILGLVLGFLLAYVSKIAKTQDELQVITLAFIGVATGLSSVLGLSPLLTCIVVGATLVNVLQNPQRIYASVNDFSSPVYVLFFTLAGASLDLRVLSAVGLMGIAYVLARAFGKLFGAWAGAKCVKADSVITNNLGLALLPQGGVSIGLIVLVRQQLPEYAVAISTVIMFSVLVYEVTGPIFAKIAIKRAGEINGLKDEIGKLSKDGLA